MNSKNTHGADLLKVTVQDNGQIILYDDDDGMLRGTVVLNCQNTTRIKSVNLKFEGRIRVHWNQDGTQHKEERTVIEHSWNFIPRSKSSRILRGRHQWDFCLRLPNHLPSSLDRQEDRHADITYRLKATAERPTFSPNFVAKRTVRVGRCLRNSYMLQQPAIFDDRHTLLDYQVSLPSIVCIPGSTIPIDFRLNNISSQIQRVRSVACFFKSYITLTCRDQFTHKSNHCLAYLRDDHFIPASSNGSTEWAKTEHLRIPGQIPSDFDADMVSIKHRLKVLISVVKSNGQIEEITGTIPITVSQVDQLSSCSATEVELLPPYETACRSSHVTLASTPLIDQEYLSVSPWSSMMSQLSRVPSYKSIASECNRLSRGSLPGYDSIASLSTAAGHI